jgi:hypothetical protein
MGDIPSHNKVRAISSDLQDLSSGSSDAKDQNLLSCSSDFCDKLSTKVLNGMIDPKDEAITIFRNVGTYSPVDAA